jgi:hypothetical protein
MQCSLLLFSCHCSFSFLKVLTPYGILWELITCLCLKNKYMTSKYQVCVCVQQNILNAKNKRDKIFVDKVETL